jgi:hypothetical protein
LDISEEMTMLDMAEVQTEGETLPFSLETEPPPTRFGSKGDPYLRSLTREERSSYIYLRQRYGSAMARRFLQFKRENPGAALPRLKWSRPDAAARVSIGDWFVGLTSSDRVRIALNGAAHDLTLKQAEELRAALGRIAA